MTDVQIFKGLNGVVVDTTSVSKVMQETNSLTYRGYAVQDLAAQCNFEEVSYLLWNGELPNREQLTAFTSKERGLREISPSLVEVIRAFPQKAHPMDTVRTGVSFLGMEDATTADNSPAANAEKAFSLLAKIPTIIATDYRFRNGKPRIAPDPSLSISENFFHMCFGEVPPVEVVRCFDISLILYAEHSFNASTFTARVVTSTLSDLYSAITAAIGALKGPLHGGANEAVMDMLLEIEEPERAREYILDALRTKKKIMGFGHRVYKSGDSRVPTMREAFHRMARLKGGDKWVEISKIAEETMISEKNIYPNLDYPAGPAYYLMGFEIPMFTPIFVMSRITGWTAHCAEQLAANSLIRPLSHYAGREQRPVPPLSSR